MLVGIALCIPLLHARADGEIFDRAVATLVMPSGIDPSRLTFVQPGTMYYNVDGIEPGDQGGAAITGNLLLTAAFGGAGGVELHGAIPDPGARHTAAELPGAISDLSTERYLPVEEVDFFTTYAGPLVVNTAVDNSFGAMTPWGVEMLANVPAGFAQGFRFFKREDAAEMNVNGFYGVLSVTLDDSSDPNGFRNASFSTQSFATVQASATPEPGAVGLLAGMGISIFALKRRRNLKRRCK
jgi:hypothetical protein